MKINEILAKYDYKNINGFDVSPEQIEYYIDMLEFWGDSITEGWYGFDLGAVPLPWLQIINEFLIYIKSIYKDFKINQIKLKYGGIRFYITLKPGGFFDVHPSEDNIFISNQISILEKELQSNKLVY